MPEKIIDFIAILALMSHAINVILPKIQSVEVFVLSCKFEFSEKRKALIYFSNVHVIIKNTLKLKIMFHDVKNNI